MKLSKKLVSLRKKKRLSQMELAEMLQVSRQAISKWETGKAVPSIENLKCLSELYQISMDDLISSEETIQMTDCISTINEESMKSKENKKKEDWNTKKLSLSIKLAGLSGEYQRLVIMRISAILLRLIYPDLILLM